MNKKIYSNPFSLSACTAMKLRDKWNGAALVSLLRIYLHDFEYAQLDSTFAVSVKRFILAGGLSRMENL